MPVSRRAGRGRRSTGCRSSCAAHGCSPCIKGTTEASSVLLTYVDARRIVTDMNRRFRRSKACTAVSEGGLEPPTARRVEQDEREIVRILTELRPLDEYTECPPATPVVDGVNE